MLGYVLDGQPTVILRVSAMKKWMVGNVHDRRPTMILWVSFQMKRERDKEKSVKVFYCDIIFLDLLTAVRFAYFFTYEIVFELVYIYICNHFRQGGMMTRKLTAWPGLMWLRRGSDLWQVDMDSHNISRRLLRSRILQKSNALSRRLRNSQRRKQSSHTTKSRSTSGKPTMSTRWSRQGRLRSTRPQQKKRARNLWVHRARNRRTHLILLHRTGQRANSLEPLGGWRLRASKVNHKMFNVAKSEMSKLLARMNQETSSKVEATRLRGKPEHSKNAQEETCHHLKRKKFEALKKSVT